MCSLGTVTSRGPELIQYFRREGKKTINVLRETPPLVNMVVQSKFLLLS